MTMLPVTRSSHPPRSWRRRLPRYHLPLALAGTVALVLFMTLPTFDANNYLLGDIFSGTFPQDYGEGDSPTDHRADQAGTPDDGRGQAPQQPAGGHQAPQGHGGPAGSTDDNTDQVVPTDDGGGQHSSLTPSAEEVEDRSFIRRFTVASGYVATGLLALTLLIGPANLLLGKRNPVSTYLRRDVGTWTVIASAVHVIAGLQEHGAGELSGFLDYFVADGSPLTNSFGLANWTGLAALAITVGLLALSNDVALRKLKAKRWKRLQRLNYALFALVVAHTFFYGALLRLDSPFTLMLGLSVGAVVVGQAVGIRLWRRRYACSAVSQPA